MCREGGHPDSAGAGLLYWGPPRPRPVCLSTWVFTCVVHYIIYNKPLGAGERVFPSSVSHSSKLYNLRKGSREPEFVDKSDRNVGNWGPTACDWPLQQGQSGEESSAREVCPKPRERLLQPNWTVAASWGAQGTGGLAGQEHLVSEESGRRK